MIDNDIGPCLVMVLLIPCNNLNRYPNLLDFYFPSIQSMYYFTLHSKNIYQFINFHHWIMRFNLTIYIIRHSLQKMQILLFNYVCSPMVKTIYFNSFWVIIRVTFSYWSIPYSPVWAISVDFWLFQKISIFSCLSINFSYFRNFKEQFFLTWRIWLVVYLVVTCCLLVTWWRHLYVTW